MVRLGLLLAGSSLMSISCGVQAPSGESRMTSPRTEVGEPLTVRAALVVDDQLLSLERRIHGTVEEQRALDFLAFNASIANVRQCMADNGEVYWSPFIDHLWGHRDSSNEVTSTAPLDEDAHLLNIVANADVTRRDEAVDDWLPEDGIDEGSPYDQALDACLPKLGGKLEPGLAKLGLRDSLERDLSKVLREIDESISDLAGYESCMAALGYNLADNSYGDVGYQGLLAFLSDRQPPLADIPSVGSQDASSAWDEYAQLYDDALGADAQCRRGGYLAAMAMLAPRLDEFASMHADELGELQQSWSDLLDLAAHNGFDPKRPPTVDLSEAPDPSEVDGG
jgi:hypothetical protein